MRCEAAALLALARGERPDLARCDPDALVRLAERHEVAPLGHVRLRGERSAPPVVADALKRAYLHHAVRNEVLARQLRELAGALADAGVDAVFFKGPWLAFAAWPDPGARPVGDVDLGIRERDWPAAVAVLRALGYGGGDLPPTGAAALARAHCGGQLRFTRPGSRMVEVHFRAVAVGPPGAPEEWLWSRRRRLDLAGVALPVPGPEAMLLHLCLHANQHGFALLRLLLDVRFALEAAPVDGRAFADLVGRLRARASVWHALALARELAGADVPPGLLEALRPGALRRAVFARLWSLDRVRRLDATRGRQRTELPRLYLLELGRLRDKARWVAGVAGWRASHGSAR